MFIPTASSRTRDALSRAQAIRSRDMARLFSRLLHPFRARPASED